MFSSQVPASPWTRYVQHSSHVQGMFETILSGHLVSHVGGWGWKALPLVVLLSAFASCRRWPKCHLPGWGGCLPRPPTEARAFLAGTLGRLCWAISVHSTQHRLTCSTPIYFLNAVCPPHWDTPLPGTFVCGVCHGAWNVTRVVHSVHGTRRRRQSRAGAHTCAPGREVIE